MALAVALVILVALAVALVALAVALVALEQFDDVFVVTRLPTVLVVVMQPEQFDVKYLIFPSMEVFVEQPEQFVVFV